MSRFKFRAWNKEDKEMVTYINAIMNWGDRGFTGIWAGTECSTFGEAVYEELSPDKIVLMQATGLTDKNGVEIFEGDIVDDGVGYVRGGLYEVVWSESRCGFAPFARDDGCGCCARDLICPDDCEVLGNKFENPELLEQI